MPQLSERLRLDLPDALPRDREPLADFLERVLALFADSEPETEDLLFFRAQRRELALRDADPAVARLDLRQQGLELAPREAALLLKLREVTRGVGRAPATRLVPQLLEPMALPADRADDLVDQRGLERHLGHDLLDRRALRLDRTQMALARHRGAPPVAERFLEPLDLVRMAADPGKGEQHGPDRLGLELAALGQDDHIVGRNLFATEAVADVEQRGHGHRDPSQSAAQGDLADLDAAADFDFLPRGQEGNLADLLEIEADGILALARQRREGFRPRCRLLDVLGEDGRLFRN